MSGLDDLVMILQFILVDSAHTFDVPDSVMQALDRLKARQANHQTFDEPVPEIG